MATRASCKSIGGCLTLLQVWIYEYFPGFRPHSNVKELGPNIPRAGRWDYAIESKEINILYSFRVRLDQLTVKEVSWAPYSHNPAAATPRTVYMGPIRYRDIGEMYNPDRVTRQLGFVQQIPDPVSFCGIAYRPKNAKMYEVTFVGASYLNTSWQRFGP